ncbi:MAG: cupin domain-containing protein [Halomonas sp.]|nr:cupin domain-containing protein [Halomonas sp.]
MRLNADFTRFACVTPEDYRWVASPSAGVERMMLDRIGDEVARATSLVRYAPNSQFDPHVHGGGEEILVLEGVFADEYGRYAAGSYLRNPIGTGHTPQIGDQGALILVKLTGGLELFVLEGTLSDGDREYAAGSWCRYPSGVALTLTAGESGVQLYLKRGHLPPAQAASA